MIFSGTDTFSGGEVRYKENIMADDRSIGESMKQQNPARVPPCP